LKGKKEILPTKFDYSTTLMHRAGRHRRPRVLDQRYHLGALPIFFDENGRRISEELLDGGTSVLPTSKFGVESADVINWTDISFTDLLNRLPRFNWSKNWSKTDKTEKTLMFSEIIRRLKADPEINPNRSPDLFALSFIFGTIEDTIFLIKHPRYVIARHQSIPQLNRRDRRELWNAIRDVGAAIVIMNTRRGLLNLEMHDRFGYMVNIFEYISLVAEDKWHNTYYSSNKPPAGTMCSCCFLPVKKIHVVVTESNEPLDSENIETIHMHIECALHFVLSFIKSVQNPNLYEKSIIPYPGFTSSREVRPSFVYFIKEFFRNSANLLEFLSKLAKPKRFIRQYSKEIKTLANIKLPELNKDMLSVRFRADPRYTACPAADCKGFALIQPDEEKNTTCTHCNTNQHFVGSKIQQERAVDKSTAQKTIQNNQNIRACPTCGKLVERRGGCPNMTCPVGHNFNWHSAKDRVPADSLHF